MKRIFWRREFLDEENFWMSFCKLFDSMLRVSVVKLDYFILHGIFEFCVNGCTCSKLFISVNKSN